MRFLSSILVFLIVITESFSQNNGTVYYSLERLEKFTNPRIQKYNLDGSMKSKFVSDSIAMEILKGDEAVFRLDFDSDHSYFQLTDAYVQHKEIIQRNFHNYECYVDRALNIPYIHIEVNSTPMFVELPPETIGEWHFTNEQKIIAGYNCRKAILKTDYPTDFETSIWFTEDVAVDLGPQAYIGFPGLVLELEYQHCLIQAISIDFENTERIDSPNLQLISSEEYFELIKLN